MTIPTKKVRCWDIDRSASFDDVSSWCLGKRGANRLLVAARPYIDTLARAAFDPQIAESIAAIFGPSIIRVASATAWPGTQLIEHVGKVYVIAFDVAVQRRMIKAQKYLSGWKQSNNPSLPEDICLYRDGDEWPVLVSVTHDGDAWLFDDDNPDAEFVRVPTIHLPVDLIPPPPDFIVETVAPDGGPA